MALHTHCIEIQEGIVAAWRIAAGWSCFFVAVAVYGWALMSTTQLTNNTLCYSNVFVCLAGWWVRQWPSKWAPTFRTSARQMWPKWLVGVSRFSNVLFILTRHHHQGLVGAPEAQDKHVPKSHTVDFYYHMLDGKCFYSFGFSCGKPAGFSHIRVSNPLEKWIFLFSVHDGLYQILCWVM